MAMSSPYVITLTPLDESVLRSRARSSTAAHRDVVRARIVLAAAEGATNAGIAAEVGVHVDTVRKWRRRFLTAGLPGLEDRPRSGRRRGFTPVQVAEVKALACTLPAETGAPLSRWSSTELANEVISRGIAETISAATVRRWLASDAIKPWQHRSWIFPRDPDFAIKAARVLDLYARQWRGQPLGPDDYVISAMRNPNCKPCAAATGDDHPDLSGPGVSSSNTGAAAPWPTSPPTTFITPGCSATSPPRPVSNPSRSWWPTS
jgi:transposase